MIWIIYFTPLYPDSSKAYKMPAIPKDKIKQWINQERRKIWYGNETRAKLTYVIMFCPALAKGRHGFRPKPPGLRNNKKALLRNCPSGASWRGQGAMKRKLPISTSDSEFHLIISHDAPQYMAKTEVKCSKSNFPENPNLLQTKCV